MATGRSAYREGPIRVSHMAEQSTHEVSQALGLSEATVRVHLFRAVRKLRRWVIQLMLKDNPSAVNASGKLR